MTQLPEPLENAAALETVGLSVPAVRSVGRVGRLLNFVRDHRAEFAVGETLWLAHFLAGTAIDPNQTLTNIIPILPMSRVTGQDAAYALGTAAAELSKLSLLKPFFDATKSGLLSAMAYKDRQKEHDQRLKEGREPLESPAILTIDTTNNETSGNHEGDLVDALRKHRLKNPETWKVITDAFGPICELVKEGVPQPAEVPDDQYLRMKGPTYRDKETLQKRGAALVSAMVMDVLHKDNTVFDSNPEAIAMIDEMVSKLVSAADTVEEIHEEVTGEKVQLPKIVIVNDRPHTRHSGISIALDGEKDKVKVIEQPRRLADSFPSYQGYETILAEEAVVKNLLVSLRGKKVALFAAKGGEAIASSFQTYLQNYCTSQKIEDAPTFITIEENNLAGSLGTQKPDFILLMGEKDSSVTDAAEDIIQFQASMIKTNVNYPVIPLMTFLEGHTADATVKRISDYIAGPAKDDNMQFSTVYLHDILANEVAERLHTLALAMKQKATTTVS